MATIGSYKGVPINAGNDASVAAQIKSIDSSGSGSSPKTSSPAPSGGGGSASYSTQNGTQGIQVGNQWTNLAYASPGLISAANTGTAPVMSPDSLSPVAPINLPGKPAPINYGGAVTGGNTALGLNNTNVTYDANGKPTISNAAAANASPTDSILKANQDLFNSYLGNIAPPPSLADEYKRAEADAGIQQKQQTVNDITAQINAITAGAQADKLSVTGQGRGIPEVIIGGQQAQIDKEAAIRVLPLQAQLAAAQGNLDFAKSRLDTFFQLRSQDITAEYNYKKDLRDSIYSFATSQQKIKIDALNKADDRTYESAKQNISLVNDWAKTAIESGQANLVTRLAALDPNSKTFQKELGAITSQIRPKPTAGTKLTVDERQAAALARFSSAFVNGATLKNGTPVLDNNGFATPLAWRQAIADAPAEGLSRDAFIKQFGYLLYSEGGNISSAYGLTPAEQKIINGALPAGQ